MKIKKYPLCESQLAQIECRKAECIFQDKGQCHNISPAITLNEGKLKTWVCWSYQTEVKDET